MAIHNQNPLALRVIWAALLASISVYVGLTFVLQAPEGFEPADVQMMSVVFGAVALGQLSFIGVLRQLLFWRPLGRGDIAPQELLPRYFTTSITSWALCESVAVFGLVLYMMTYQQLIPLIFMAISALAMIALVPLKIPEHPAAGKTW